MLLGPLRGLGARAISTMSLKGAVFSARPNINEGFLDIFAKPVPLTNTERRKLRAIPAPVEGIEKQELRNRETDALVALQEYLEATGTPAQIGAGENGALIVRAYQTRGTPWEDLLRKYELATDNDTTPKFKP